MLRDILRAGSRAFSAAAAPAPRAPARAAAAAAGGAAAAAPAAAPAAREARPVFFPQMSMTLVRRVTARLPYNHFLFRVDPKYTKADIKEYLTKVHGASVARVTTSISLGALRRLRARARALRPRATAHTAPPPRTPSQARRGARRAVAQSSTS
jgi:ribosomal protein L23